MKRFKDIDVETFFVLAYSKKIHESYTEKFQQQRLLKFFLQKKLRLTAIVMFVTYFKTIKEVSKMKELSKMTKREKKEYYKQFRGTWGNVSPVTRKEDKGKYRRKKDKERMQGRGAE